MFRAEYPCGVECDECGMVVDCDERRLGLQAMKAALFQEGWVKLESGRTICPGCLKKFMDDADYICSEFTKRLELIAECEDLLKG